MPAAGFKSVFRSEGTGNAAGFGPGHLNFCDNSAGYTPDQHFGDVPGDLMVTMENASTTGLGPFGTRKFRYGTFAVASGTPIGGDMLCYTDNLKQVFTTVGNSQGSRNRPAGACMPANCGGPDAYVVLNAGNSSLGNQIWVQYSGYHPYLNFTGSSAVIGDIGVMSGTDKTLVLVAANTAPTNVPVCVVLANVASNYGAGMMMLPD